MTNSMTRSATYSAVTLPEGMRLDVAKIVPTKKLICAMPMPKNPGASKPPTERTPSWRSDSPNLKRIPRRTNCGTKNRNCKAPPISTPTPSETAALEKCLETAATDEAMMERFSNTGVAAGVPKT